MLKNKKVYKKRQLSYYVLMFLVTVNHFAHFGATFTSMRLFSGKKSLQLNEILKIHKHIFTDTIELKVMRKLSPRKKQLFWNKKNAKKRVSEQKRDSAKKKIQKSGLCHFLRCVFQTPDFV